MSPEDQKRILGYFIEEAKDHLNTIEQGLLNLADTLNDSEMMNEVFRAAHSVKGGAAMLGLNSIQRTSHRMEDFFKVMKESPMRPDRDLETMLLQIFDGLQEQLEQLQSPFGLTNDQAQEIMAPLEPIFVQAEAHINSLVAAAPAAVPAAAPQRPAAVAAAPHPETSALQLVFRSDVPALLRDMLATFKQPDSSTSRQALSRLCQRMHSLGEQFELAQWCSLTQVVEQAIANPAQTYRTLAPVVIKDLKQAQDQVLAGGIDQVAASTTLKDLLPVQAEPEVASDDFTLDALLAEALNDDVDGPDLADLFAAAEEGDADDLALADTENWLDDLTLEGAENVTETGLESVFGEFDTPLPAEPTMPQGTAGSIGPEVGAAELNSLADLFEGAPDSLTDIWEEDLAEVSLEDLDLEDDVTADRSEAEFGDLFATESTTEAPAGADGSAADDMASLFGYDLDGGEGGEPAPVNQPAPRPDQAADFLAELSIEETVPVSGAETETVDPLDFLDDGPDVVPAAMAAAPLDDDFFALDESAESPAVHGDPDEVDSFFDALPDDGFIDDDDAQTMPELHLELDLDSSTGGGSGADNGLFNREATSLLTSDREVSRFDLDDAATPTPPGEEDAFLDDPFGELNLTDSTFDLAFDRASDEATAEPELTATEADVSFDVPRDNDDGAELTAASLEEDGLWIEDAAEESSFADLESLLDEPLLESDLLPSSERFLSDDLGLAGETFDRVGDDAYSSNGMAEAPPAPVGQSFDDYGLDDNNFDDLEALLGEEAAPTDPVGSEQTDNGFSAPLSGAGLTAGDRPFDGGDDEFGDLEKLLEEADQLGGSAPSMGSRRAASVQAARRSPRRAASTTDQTMRVSVGHLDTLSNLVGELVVNRNSLEQDQERLRQFLDNLLHQVSQLNDVGQRMRDLYERSLLESSLIANRQAFALGVSSSDRGGGNHATGATFDALEMDRFTGFHTLSQEMIELIVRVREASSDIEFTIDSTDQIARQFRQVTTQLQEGLNKARMVPFGQTADRLPRAVRDISLKCGKEAQLVVEGRDTLIDKMILERLYDPMTHLVNNAITHGIESPEERLAIGKGREGTITVRAFYQGNQTVIYIADDGGGINPAVVKAKALKQGLITPTEAQTMTEIEVYDLLFLPGFSTRDQADDFSGRGVGMDVVRTALSDIRGSITIESEVGKGTSFTIRLPLTLSITKALSCVNNQARIAFPMDGVEDMFDVPKERIQTDDQGHACILWRDTLLPFRPLSDLLRFNRSLGRGRVYGGPQDEDVVSMVVLRSASTFIALQVDQVIGEQEIVIKQLEGPVPKPIGIAGATVLGDGRVMPIADVLELIDLASGRLRRDASTSLWTQTVDEEPVEVVAHTDPTVLIVDDSITVRELLSMSFNKVGYRVEQARDGQEAWEKLRSGLPCDLVFCDIEMPRMDGLELLSRMQKDSALSQIPTAMLTSRGADRHRQMAVDLGAKGYFTKPYLEEMLLDAAKRMLEGENMIRRKLADEPET